MRPNTRSTAYCLALAASIATPVALADDLPAALPQPHRGTGFVLPQRGAAPQRHGLMTRGQFGAGLGLSGPLSTGAGPGPYGMIAGGWEIPNGLTGFVELGVRYHAGSVTRGGAVATAPRRDVSVLDIPLGIGARWTALGQSAIHPFIEGALDVHFVSATHPNATTRMGVTFGAAVTAGAEIDLAASFSMEIGVRAEYMLTGNAVWNDLVFTGSRTGANDFLLTPFLGGTYRY